MEKQFIKLQSIKNYVFDLSVSEDDAPFSKANEAGLMLTFKSNDFLKL